MGFIFLCGVTEGGGAVLANRGRRGFAIRVKKKTLLVGKKSMVV